MTDAPTSHDALRDTVHGLMPELIDELADLVRIPSVSLPGNPVETHAELERGCEAVQALLRRSGVEQISLLDLPGTAPVIMGEIPAPPGAPTVLLYGHYDVVPAGDESLWRTAPFEPTVIDGAMYGRGTADTKGNIVACAGALRAWGGRPPVGVRIVIEGLEEVGGAAFSTYPATDPEKFACDVLVVADVGNVRPGIPTLTVGLRGMANVLVEVRTLESARHSGQFGGAAPDALLALLRGLATLHDDAGDVAVEGLRRVEWDGGGPDEEEFRALAGLADGMDLVGTGTLGSRVWSGPAITVIGMDTPTVAGSLNAVQDYARAKLNVRVHPAQDPAEAQRLVVEHLERAMPFGVQLTVTPTEIGQGYSANTDSAVYDKAKAAWSQAWDAPIVLAGQGGSIPVVSSLHDAAPEADVLLVGVADGYSGIHAPNERVVLDELERTVVAMADLLGRLGASS
ncbi:M20/M25/M40 family metallo-hydrolase [Longivirga aurantiaca]|uniref:M20/M25/M40 family metallo-hydrolase n=1 Tax=Longivirga aurantiaca TaxID=1837743 RepID=A0ABW1T172_9ACTN